MQGRTIIALSFLLTLIAMVGIGCLSDGRKKANIDTSEIEEEILNPSSTYTRDIWQKPESVIEMLGDIKDKTVADLGTGSGYFALRLLDKAAKVIAIDIDQASIAYLDTMKANYLPEDYKDKLDLRLAQPNNPNLERWGSGCGNSCQYIFIYSR